MAKTTGTSNGKCSMYLGALLKVINFLQLFQSTNEFFPKQPINENITRGKSYLQKSSPDGNDARKMFQSFKGESEKTISKQRVSSNKIIFWCVGQH